MFIHIWIYIHAISSPLSFIPEMSQVAATTDAQQQNPPYHPRNQFHFKAETRRGCAVL